MNNLIIAKFGGTSVADHAAMSNCAAIIKNSPATRVVVVSASAGVTNLLVELAHHSLNSAQISERLTQIQQIQQAILHKLDKTDAVQTELNNLLKQLEELAHHTELLHRAELKDQLLSMGERMSSLLFTQVLIARGIAATNFDARRVLRTNSQFGQGEPQPEEIAKLAQEQLASELTEHVIVTQGFVGADEHGQTTTLGRGGSDYTAALLAEALNAQICEIWTDVIGVYTTDPRITDTARPLPELSFEEAAEMATFGAKVLHPATMEPALRKNIRVFVGSSKAPEQGGTWIVKDCQHEPAYRAITRRKEQVMVTVKTPKMLYAQGFLQQVFAIIAKQKLSVDLVTTSEIAVSFTLDNPADSVAQQLNQRTISELETLCEVTVEDGFDLVTVVGNNMHSSAGVPSRIFAALAEYQIRMICYGANPHNISVLVDQKHSSNIVKVLHRELFE